MPVVPLLWIVDFGNKLSKKIMDGCTLFDGSEIKETADEPWIKHSEFNHTLLK